MSKWTRVAIIIFLIAIAIPMTTHIDNGKYIEHDISQQYTWSFDDWPSQYTTTLLDILKGKNIKATFYIVWKNISWYKDVIVRMNNEWHEICAHTYNHSDITTMGDKELANDMQKTISLLSDIIWKKVSCFRPPYGKLDERTNWLLYWYNVRWSLSRWVYDSMDWTQMWAGELILKFASSYTKYTEFLFHDRFPNTVDALPILITIAEKR